MKNNFPLSVEFYGLPGAGKTTICEQILSNKPSKIKLARINLQKTIILKQILSEPFRYWPTSKYLIALIFRFGLNKRIISNYKQLFTQVAENRFNRINSSCDYIFFDQGIIQAFCCTFMFEKEKGISFIDKQGKKLVQDLAKIIPSVLIHIRTSPEEGANRIKKRSENKSRLDCVPTDKCYEELVNLQSIFIKFSEILYELENVRVITIDGAESPQKSANIILDQLLKKEI